MAQPAAQPSYIDPNDPSLQQGAPQGFMQGLALKLARAADAGDGGDRYQKMLEAQYTPAIVRGQIARSVQNSQDVGAIGDLDTPQGLAGLVQGQGSAPMPTSLAAAAQSVPAPQMPPQSAPVVPSPISSAPGPMQAPAASLAPPRTPAPLPAGGDQALADLGLGTSAAANGSPPTPQAPPMSLTPMAGQPAPQASAPPMNAAMLTNLAQIKRLQLTASIQRRSGDLQGALTNENAAAQLQNAMNGAQGATGDDAAVAQSDPLAYQGIQQKRIAPVTLKDGETEDLGNGKQIYGAHYGITGNRPFVQQGANVTASAPLAGDYSAEGGIILNKNDGKVAGTYSSPQTVGPGASLDGFTPGVNGAAAPGAPAPQGGQAPQGQGDPGAPGAGVNFFNKFVLPHEGGYNASDMNGSPTNFGINQKANPNVDVKSLNPQQAAQIFNDKYYVPSGAPNLPPALAAVHADTYFINPLKAKQFLAQSGGDPSKYLQLRQQWMSNLVNSNPAAAKYANAWGNRNNDLATLIAQDQGGPQSAQQAPVQTPPGAPGVSGQSQVTPLVQGKGYVRNSDGTVTSPTGETTAGPTFVKPSSMQEMMGNEDYKQAQAGLAAYKAMQGNAGKMTGPAAYTMLDTMARAINPGAVARPTVIQTIESHIGLPAKFVGSLDNAYGKGNLPIGVQQQIMDATYPFIQAHWQAANAANAANRSVALRHGFNPDDFTAPLEPLPAKAVISPNGGSSPQVRTAADYAAVPHGGTYIDPNGVHRTKQ